MKAKVTSHNVPDESSDQPKSFTRRSLFALAGVTTIGGVVALLEKYDKPLPDGTLLGNLRKTLSFTHLNNDTMEILISFSLFHVSSAFFSLNCT